MNPKTFLEAKESALRLLARREYGAYELKQRLLQKGYEEDIVNEILRMLIEMGLQSDERFVECYVRRRMEKGFGPLHITNELLKNRIALDLIEKVIADYDEEWANVLKKLYRKKFGSSNSKSLKDKTKQLRFFQSRGFDILQIRALLSLSGKKGSEGTDEGEFK